MPRRPLLPCMFMYLQAQTKPVAPHPKSWGKIDNICPVKVQISFQ